MKPIRSLVVGVAFGLLLAGCGSGGASGVANGAGGADSGGTGGSSGRPSVGGAPSTGGGGGAATTGGGMGGSGGAATTGGGMGGSGGAATTRGGTGGSGGTATTGGSGGTGGMGQFTVTFDASRPNHFGPEHAGLTAYAELVDTTAGMKMRVGDIYSSPMTATGYAKWVWKNVGVSGHTYTFAIFDDVATMNPTCKNGMPPTGDAGWTFPANGGASIAGDYTFNFPTGSAIRDPNKCAWFPIGPIMGAVPIPTPM